MTASVRILTTASVDSSPAILIVAPDGSKILVNCGEGCQRSFLEHGQKLSTVQAVCLTDLGHDTIGGLPGLILTASDTAAASSVEAAKAAVTKTNAQGNGGGDGGTTADPPPPNITTLSGLDLIGPTGTQAFVHSLRHFMRRDKFPLRVQEGFLDNIRPAVKQTKRMKKGVGDAEQLGFSIQSLGFMEKSTRTRLSKKRPRDDGAQETERYSREKLSFLFTTPPVPGKFMPEKAAALGVPKGPLFGQLKSGKSITFTDKSGLEKTVTSDQVVTPPSSGIAVLVLNCQDYDAHLSNCDATFEEVRSVIKAKNVVLEIVVHLVRKMSTYPTSQSLWERNLGPETEHIFLPTSGYEFDFDGTPFRSAAVGALSRSLLCPDIFQTPLLQEPVIELDYKLGRSMMEYKLLPRSKTGFIQMSLPSSVADEHCEAKQLAHDLGAVELSQQILVADNSNDMTSDAFEGQLLFTGTGSALPCKHRNVTGMCLTARNGNSILLDIGEGTVGQILRAKGQKSEQGVRNTSESIRAVWISHPHADHHLGILRLLVERKSKHPLILLAPTSLIRFLQEYEEVDNAITAQYIPFDCKDLVDENPEALAKLKEALDLTGCRAVPVAHCPHSYAVVLDGTCFGRLAYSGDCRPSNLLAQVAQRPLKTVWKSRLP
jgi:ribonuclease Z